MYFKIQNIKIGRETVAKVFKYKKKKFKGIEFFTPKLEKFPDWFNESSKKSCDYPPFSY